MPRVYIYTFILESIAKKAKFSIQKYFAWYKTKTRQCTLHFIAPQKEKMFDYKVIYSYFFPIFINEKKFLKCKGIINFLWWSKKYYLAIFNNLQKHFCLYFMNLLEKFQTYSAKKTIKFIYKIIKLLNNFSDFQKWPFWQVWL